MHEYNECYLYYSFLQQEPDSRIKSIWEEQLDNEITHLHMAVDLFQQYEGRDVELVLPASFPELVKFQSNKDYVRDIIAGQIELTADGDDLVPASELPDSARYFEYQHLVNIDHSSPTTRVIEQMIDRHGQDYRLETEGPHPVEAYRARETAGV